MSRSTLSSLQSKRVEEWLDRMNLEELIGQMSQIDLNLLLEDVPDEIDPNAGDNTAQDNTGNKKPEKQLNMTKVEYYIGKMGIGSVLNNVLNHHWTASQYRHALIQIQTVALNNNHPPVIYGLDSVHGANYVHGATIVPQPINLAATFNSTMAYRAGVLASRDTRAAGIGWLFSPLLGIALEPKWSRVYETFGEDPLLVGSMAQAMVQGIQAVFPSTTEVPSRAAACAKHFIGYTLPHHGHDRAPSWIPKRHLYQYFVPPWRKVAGEVLTVMEDYTETNGVPTVANREALQTLLRFQLGFNDGMVVTDYAEIWNLVDWHHTASSRVDAVAQSIQSGVDMSMIPMEPESFVSAIKEAISAGTLSDNQIRQAARRVLHVKEKLHMLDDEVLTMENGKDAIAKVGGDREEALNMARQSVVLVKNENDVLPLSPAENLKVLITGPTADSLSFQSGGWSWQWQGTDDKETAEWFTYGTTVLDTAKELPWLVSYQCGVDIMGHDCSDSDGDNAAKLGGVVDKVEDWIGIGGPDDNMPLSIKSATENDADYIIVCVGEEAYTEKPGDISDLAIRPGQVLLVEELAKVKKPSAKIILIYFGGRPRLLSQMEPLVDAILVGFLPGPDAGQAMVEIMSGAVNPSGRLPLTYPKHEDLQGLPYFHAVSEMCTIANGERMPHYQYGKCDVQWPFGHGLSYTTFEYSNLQLSSTEIHYHARGQKKRDRHRQARAQSTGDDKAASVQISVDVTNTGTMTGQETVLFFTFDESRAVTPEYKMLRVFEKISLAPGEVKTVTATLTDKELQFIGPHDDSHLVVQDGMVLRVGVGAHTDCRVRTGNDDSLHCTDAITVVAGSDYIGACEAACDVWAKSPCSKKLTDHTCYNMCVAASANNGPGMLKEGWGWPYVNCIESVASSPQMMMEHNDDHCIQMTTACRDIFGSSHTPVMPPTSWAIGVGLTTGSLAAIVIALAIRGNLFRMLSRTQRQTESPENVEFTPVPIVQDLEID